VRKLFVLADEHTQFFVIDTNIALYHISGYSAIIVYIVFDKIKHHIGIV